MDGFMSSLFKKKADEEESCGMKFGLARIFKYQELKKATNSFATELGHGGYGRVYLGKLGDGQMVAVKVLFDRNPKRLEQFFNEVNVLSRVRHENLIGLYGCTNPTKQELLLVYEYAPNGTVSDNLHGQQSALNWAARIRIAMEAAKALAYLHGLEPPIIHRDVKTPNILLDGAFHAKVADLGICRLLPWDTDHVSTLPQGTMGYRDPEYDRCFRLTDKTDVYSFGVVLMELISGQQAVDVTRDHIYLDGMAISKIMNDKLEEFVDPKLGYHTNNDIKRTINSMAQLAAECLQPFGNLRPSMAQVVTVLEGFQNEIEHIGLNEFVSLSSNPQKEVGDGSLDHLNDDRDNDSCGNPLEILQKEMPAIPLAELRRLTGNFGQKALIGEGENYRVFKATFNTGESAAIKKQVPNTLYPGGPSEVNFLGRLSHPSFIKIVGYCFEDNELLLAYEFMGKGSLEDHLFRHGAAFDPLSWDIRLKIAIGAARGLAFLHSSRKQVIYRDFKTSNILLDLNCNAKLSDSRLATYGPTGGISYIEAPVMGTLGYAAPEYIATGCLYVKSDVYGFGVVLLEMLTGRRAIDRSRPRVEQKLVVWATSYLADRRKLARLMDPRLEGHYPSNGAFQAAQLALNCLAREHEKRPSMKEVVETLEHIEALNNA